MIVYLNGEFLPEEHAHLSIWDRGFLLGDGIFETLKVTEGKGEFVEEHFERFLSSSAFSGIPLPFNASSFGKLIEELCEKNDLREASVRMTVSRGAHKGGLTLSGERQPTVLCTAQPIPIFPKIWYEEGLKVISYKVQSLNSHSEEGSMKATQYLQNIQGKLYAEKQGGDEALFVGPHGELLELTTANLFLIRSGVVFTPPLSTGILPGITRRMLIECLEEKGKEVRQELLHLKEIESFDEGFVCSSVRGMVPIQSIDGHNFRNRNEAFGAFKSDFEAFKRKKA